MKKTALLCLYLTIVWGMIPLADAATDSNKHIFPFDFSSKKQPTLANQHNESGDLVEVFLLFQIR